MLLIPEKRKIVLDTNVNAVIAQAIPHSKALDMDGKRVLVVNHGVEECKVLANIGITVPSPIETYYDWPARFPAMQHQKETAAFATSYKRSVCLNAPGTGKTISTLWAADFLMNEGLVKRVLIVAPLSTLKVVWGHELKHQLPFRTFEICTGSKEKRLKILEKPGTEFVIINHDGFTNMHSYLKDFDAVIYDEATALKNPSTTRYKLFYRWVNAHNPWLWLLTGTPISQSPVDAWALARLIESPFVPKSFTAFRDKVMQKVTNFKWVPRPDALDTCKKVLQPSIRFSMDECKDLPETVYLGRKADLSPQQLKAFKEMQDKAVAYFSATQQVSAANSAVMLSKLMQISCGVVYGDNQEIKLDAAGRLDTLFELMEEIGDKLIVFVPLKGVQLWLFEEMKKKGIDVALVNGDVSKTARDKIFNDFQHTDAVQVLLAHPKVAAHGLTLTRAKDVIWFAPIHSLEQYEQANARIRRLTTVGKTAIWHIYATAFEAELYRRLRTKQNVLAEFLDLVKGINID